MRRDDISIIIQDQIESNEEKLRKGITITAMIGTKVPIPEEITIEVYFHLSSNYPC